MTNVTSPAVTSLLGPALGRTEEKPSVVALNMKRSEMANLCK